MKDIAVHIKPQILFWALGIIAMILLISALRDLIVIFFLAFIVSAGFRPVVDRLEKRKIPRVLSLLGIYALAAIIIFFILYLTIGTFLEQFNRIVRNLPEITETILTSVQETFPEEWGVLSDKQIEEAVDQVQSIQTGDAQTLNDVFDFFSNNVRTFGNTGITIISNVTNIVFSAFIVFIVAGYLIARKKDIYHGLVGYIPKKSQDRVVNIYNQVESRLGEWLLGVFILMFIVGLASYIAIMIPSIFGVEGYTLYRFALLIALIAGLTESFPNIGPTISLVLTLLLAFGTGASLPILIYIAIAFSTIQQLEALFIVPLVMKRAVDLDPIIVILAIAAGLQLGGVLGAILSIPVIVIIRIILDDLNEERKQIEDEKIQKESEEKEANESNNTAHTEEKPRMMQRLRSMFRSEK